MLETNASQFASAQSPALHLCITGSNWKSKLETDNLEQECKSNEECKSKGNNFSRGYSCIKEALQAFKQIWKKSLKYLNMTSSFCNSLLGIYSRTCINKHVWYLERELDKLFPLDDSK